MTIEHDKFWFVIIYTAALCFLGAIVFIGATIVFGSHDPDTIENYTECVAQNISENICDLMYPPIKIQSVNWTVGGVIPFP